jgi:hypothetical protein
MEIAPQVGQAAAVLRWLRSRLSAKVVRLKAFRSREVQVLSGHTFSGP